MMKRAFALVVVVAGIAVVSAQEAPRAPARGRGAAPQEQFVLAPKSVKLNEWVAPHKPHTKLSEVLAKHKGKTDWVEPVVDDDLLLVTRWLLEDVPTAGDPIENLSRAFLHHSAQTAAKYEADKTVKGSYLIDAIRRRNADGVIFAAPSFCDPALLDQPMMISRLEALKIPYITMQYAENSGQMQPIREQSGTFADSIKLWGAS